MTPRERMIAYIHGEPTDRIPFVIRWGPWDDTLERWQQAGMVNDDDWRSLFDFDPLGTPTGVNFDICPAFEREVLADEGDTILGLTSPYGAGRFGSVGVSGGFHFDSREHPGAHPSAGLSEGTLQSAGDEDVNGLNLRLGGLYVPKGWDVGESYGGIDGEPGGDPG